MHRKRQRVCCSVTTGENDNEDIANDLVYSLTRAFCELSGVPFDSSAFTNDVIKLPEPGSRFWIAVCSSFSMRSMYVLKSVAAFPRALRDSREKGKERSQAGSISNSNMFSIIMHSASRCVFGCQGCSCRYLWTQSQLI